MPPSASSVSFMHLQILFSPTHYPHTTADLECVCMFSDSNKRVSTGVVSGLVIAQTSVRVSVERRIRQQWVRYARRARKWGVNTNSLGQYTKRLGQLGARCW